MSVVVALKEKPTLNIQYVILLQNARNGKTAQTEGSISKRNE